MKVLQKGGYVLETEEAFFDWLEKDSNIEDLLKSTLQFLEYKTKVAASLVKSASDELNEYWRTKLLTRIQTDKTIQSSFESTFTKIRTESLSDAMAAKKPLDLTDIGKLRSLASRVQMDSQSEGEKEEVKYLSRISAQINQTQTLKGLYDERKKEICSTYFAKKGKPEKYKEALDQKRKSIREKVNRFIESFTGESNRRHRLYILNYAIDFAQNWTSFQGNYKLNLLITGGAGLGKTTFAKSIGSLFFEFGLLARDLFQIREKTDFIGQYVGWTPMKTYSTLYGALESMVFIDEAYSVSGCGTDTRYDYGQEFIDALVDVSQKTRGLISVVAAGYKTEMHNCFLDKNPGMRRRFPNELELTPYSSIDLDNILTTNVLRPIFETQLNSILKIDLLKEPEIYFQSPSKYEEFGKEILLRLPEIIKGPQLDEALQKFRRNPSFSTTEKSSSRYTDILYNETRTRAIQTIAESTIAEYPLIIRYRTKIIGLYRFFMQLAAFDTNFPSFEAMYNAHQFLWKMVTENNPNQTYKYNNYRIMHLIYLSSHQQRREIMKSYLLRKYYSEKEGSLFPNQAGDMDTLAAFIKSQPNLRLNKIPTLEEVTKLFNEYFRSRGGSKFILKATKTGEAIELLIYHIGGGFINFSDFEEGVLAKIFKGFTYDGQTVSALWNLNAQTPEHRETIIRKINSFYSEACTTLLREAEESLKAHDSNEKNEKRLPSGIDIRFLEAEAMSFTGANQGVELGDETKMKYLEYVSFGELKEGEEEMRSILNEITAETGAVEPPKTLSLDDAVLCRDTGVVIGKPKPTDPADMPPGPPVLTSSDAVDLGNASEFSEEDEIAKLYRAAAERYSRAGPSVPRTLTSHGPSFGSWGQFVSEKPKPELPPPPPPTPGLTDLNFPLNSLRVYIPKGGKKPQSYLDMEPIIRHTRTSGTTDIEEEYKVFVTPLPHVEFPANSPLQLKLAKYKGYAYFLVQWMKGVGSERYTGQGFVYVLRESKQCSSVVPILKNQSAPEKPNFYEFIYLGRLDEIYPGLDSKTLGTRTFTKGDKPTGPPPPPPDVSSLSSTKVAGPPANSDKISKETLKKIYPPTDEEIAAYKTKSKSTPDEIKAWIQSYTKEKAIEYSRSKSIKLNEPEILYYGGPQLTSFGELVGKQLSFAKEYPNLHVAKILSYEQEDGVIEVPIPEQNRTLYYRVYKVKYTFTEEGVMKSGDFMYGLSLPSADATFADLKYPLKFDILDTEDTKKNSGEEDEEDEEEDEEEAALRAARNRAEANLTAGQKERDEDEEEEEEEEEKKDEPFAVEFVNESLKGAAADLNQLVGTTNES